MGEKRAVAKLGEKGYVQIQLAEPPGCATRAQAAITAVLWVLAWFGAGFVVGALAMKFF